MTFMPNNPRSALRDARKADIAAKSKIDPAERRLQTIRLKRADKATLPTIGKGKPK